MAAWSAARNVSAAEASASPSPATPADARTAVWRSAASAPPSAAPHAGSPTAATTALDAGAPAVRTASAISRTATLASSKALGVTTSSRPAPPAAGKGEVTR